jgi:hypothetical protein
MDPQQAPLTRADLDQAAAAIIAAIRADISAVRGEIAAHRGETSAEFAAARAEMATGFAAVRGEMATEFAAVRGEIRAEIGRAVVELRARIEAAERAGAANLSDVRSELLERINLQDRRMERMDVNMGSILTQLAGIHRAMTVAEQADIATAGNLVAMRRTIDDLARRVEALEKKAS